MIETFEFRKKRDEVKIEPILSGSGIFRISDGTGYAIFLNLGNNKKKKKPILPFIVIPKKSSQDYTVSITFGDAIEVSGGKISEKKYNRAIQTTKTGLDSISSRIDSEENSWSPAGHKVLSMINKQLEEKALLA